MLMSAAGAIQTPVNTSDASMFSNSSSILLDPHRLLAADGGGDDRGHTFGALLSDSAIGVSSHQQSVQAAVAPRSCATMNGTTSTGRTPAKVSEKPRAIVTAGLAKDVEAVNQ